MVTAIHCRDRRPRRSAVNERFNQNKTGGYGIRPYQQFWGNLTVAVEQIITKTNVRIWNPPLWIYLVCDIIYIK